MFPTDQLVIAAEDAYRRERLTPVRPPRRTRRNHRLRHPRPTYHRGFPSLVTQRLRAVLRGGHAYQV